MGSRRDLAYRFLAPPSGWMKGSEVMQMSNGGLPCAALMIGDGEVWDGH